MLPGKKVICQDVSLSVRICTCTRIGNKFIQTNSIASKSFDFYALAKYESNDVTITAQLIFIRGIEIAFHVHDVLAGLWSLKGTPTGKAKETVIAEELVWERLTGVTASGVRSLYHS